MRESILNLIKSNVENKFITIIYGPKGSGKSTFLFNDIKKIFSNNNQYIIKNFSYKFYVEAINRIEKMDADNKKYIFLIDDIFDLENPESLINLLYSCKNIKTFATSDISINFALKNKITLVRGRIYTIFFPNFLFEEYKKNNLNKNLFDYYRKMTGLKSSLKQNDDQLFNIICQNFGKVLTFNKLLKQKDIKESIVTLINKFSNYLGNILFYVISRVDLLTLKDITTGFVVYPTNYNLIPTNIYSNDNLRLFLTTSIVEKLFYDNWKVYAGTYRFQEMVNNRRSYYVKNLCLLARKENCPVLIMTNINDDFDDDIQLFYKLKISITKIVVELGSFDKKYDFNGVMHVGIETFLCKGVDL